MRVKPANLSRPAYTDAGGRCPNGLSSSGPLTPSRVVGTGPPDGGEALEIPSFRSIAHQPAERTGLTRQHRSRPHNRARAALRPRGSAIAALATNPRGSHPRPSSPSPDPDSWMGSLLAAQFACLTPTVPRATAGRDRENFLELQREINGPRAVWQSGRYAEISSCRQTATILRRA